MGVPKQKWTSEEEDALRAGIEEHGPGKWSTILKDPKFGSVLHLRSNVDLKDKWRNINVMASGYGSRHRGRPTKPKTQPIDKSENVSSSRKEENNMKICISDPSTKSAGSLQNGTSKMQIPRLDSLILDTISNLKQSLGSSRAEIAEYIEENHSVVPTNLEKLLKDELKALLDSGKLIKVKHRYRIPKSCSQLNVDKKPSSMLLEAKQDCGSKILTKADIDAELEKMWKMTPQQAAEMAVKAVAEAEAAISEAEKAAKDAEAAEADAELAKVFAAAAMRALKQTALCT